MSGALQDRHLVIQVRDRDGFLLKGTDIAFDIDGAPYGGVTNSDGRADLTLPASETRPVHVVVAFDGKSQDALVALSESSFRFTFGVSQHMKLNYVVFATGLGLATVSIFLAFIFGAPTPIQLKLIQGLFCVGLAGFATGLTGFLNVNMNLGSRLSIAAGGALAVFVLLWFTNAKL